MSEENFVTRRISGKLFTSTVGSADFDKYIVDVMDDEVLMRNLATVRAAIKNTANSANVQGFRVRQLENLHNSMLI